VADPHKKQAVAVAAVVDFDDILYLSLRGTKRKYTAPAAGKFKKRSISD
jgi:hypothetical protein